MNLHADTKNFTALVTFSSKHFNITPAFVEKDYLALNIEKRIDKQLKYNCVLR